MAVEEFSQIFSLTYIHVQVRKRHSCGLRISIVSSKTFVGDPVFVPGYWTGTGRIFQKFCV